MKNKIKKKNKRPRFFDNDFIQTFKGLEMNVFKPKKKNIEIEDIAHALSHICRFAGHTNKFYSVAQHSILCAVMAMGREPVFMLKVLLHDAAEAYIGDLASPIKTKIKYYKKIDNNLSSVIFRKFGLTISSKDKADIKKIDNVAVQIEWFQYMVKKPLVHQPLPVFDYDIKKSKEMFIYLFKHINSIIKKNENIKTNSRR